MGFGPDQLRDKALLALEDAVQECRYRAPRRSFAIRFALAYLWAYSGGERWPFDQLWRSLGDPMSPWSFSGANTDLNAIYRLLGLERPPEVEEEMWRRWEQERADERARRQGSAEIAE